MAALPSWLTRDRGDRARCPGWPRSRRPAGRCSAPGEGSAAATISGASKPGPKPLRHGGVARVAHGAPGLAGLVGHAQLHAERRRGQGQDHAGGQHRGEGRPPLDHGGPPLGGRAPGRVRARRAGGPATQPVRQPQPRRLGQPGAGEAEQRGQQGQRAEQHHGDRGGGRDRDPVQQRLAQHQQAEHADDHGACRRSGRSGPRCAWRCTAASSGGRPPRSASRNRVTMNSA